MKSMDTRLLQHVAYSHHQLKKYFQGVYATDALPKFVHSYPSAYIINTHPKSKPGEHWVAVYFDVNLKGIYFDSYGFPPRNRHVVNFLKKNCVTWTFSNQVLQHPFSNLCGVYCIYFLVKKCQGHSLYSILSRFTNDLDLNDRRVRRFLHRIFPHMQIDIVEYSSNQI
jgi:hypothetical protein